MQITVTNAIYASAVFKFRLESTVRQQFLGEIHLGAQLHRKIEGVNFESEQKQTLRTHEKERFDFWEAFIDQKSCEEMQDMETGISKRKNSFIAWD